MASCVLDKDGKLDDPVKVTDVSAYAWVPATEMYLHMRVYRYSFIPCLGTVRSLEMHVIY